MIRFFVLVFNYDSKFNLDIFCLVLCLFIFVALLSSCICVVFVSVHQTVLLTLLHLQ